MKAKTIRLTVECEYCGLPLTYKKEENKKAAHNHLHSICKKEKEKTEKLFKSVIIK